MRDVTVRAMRPADAAAADGVFRLAFGTWFKVPDPTSFRGDAALIEPRLFSYPDGGLVAERGGRIVGMSFASRWGALGVLGPVAVHPELWRGGIARLLVGGTVELIDGWGCRAAALFTFPQSASHLRLYQEFGFWPRHLIPVVVKPVASSAPATPPQLLSAAAGRDALIAACNELAATAWPGLDLAREIAAVLELGLGDVVLLAAGTQLDGFAICHCGKGSEAGSKQAYIKFALARPGAGAGARLERLIAACEAYARGCGVAQITCGTSTARIETYRLLVAAGFRTFLPGVAMHRPYGELYDRPDVLALDDWR